MELLLASADAASLIRRVAEMLDQGRLGVARPLLAALRRIAPDAPDIAALEARLLLREDRPDDAIAVLDAALGNWPQTVKLLCQRAELRFMQQDLPGALADAADAVLSDRHNADGIALLGVLLIEAGRLEEAAQCLADAVAAVPGNPSFRLGLAQAQERLGDAAGALATLAAGIALAPADVALRNAGILLETRRQGFAVAAAMADQARLAGAADACTFGLFGHALSSLGRHDAASDMYQEALKLAPDDPYVRHLVASAGALPAGDHAPQDYVRVVFNGYADRFDDHLISLGYRVPGLIRATVQQLGVLPTDGSRFGPVLDLGCGTGLLAVALSDLPLRDLVGIDISPRMVDVAREKALYAELRVADLLVALADESACYPLVLAGDVFCYFGDLRAVLAAIRARLAPGGVLIFTVEHLAHPIPGTMGPTLGRLGRYAHATQHVMEAADAAGLAVRSLRQEHLRFEDGEPVAGLLCVLARGQGA